MGLFDFLNWLESGGKSSKTDGVTVITNLMKHDRKAAKTIAEGGKVRTTRDDGVTVTMWKGSDGRMHVHGSDGTKVVY